MYGITTMFANKTEDALLSGAKTMVWTIIQQLEKSTQWVDNNQRQMTILCREQCLRFCWALWFLSRLFSTSSPTSCQMPKHLCMCICFPLSSAHRPHFAEAFILSISVQRVLGYSQVSSERKDLFCCFGSPVSVGSLGKGWGSSTAHLCLGLVWPLSCGHASLHCSTLLWDSFYAVWYDICPFHLKKNKKKPFTLHLLLSLGTEPA